MRHRHQVWAALTVAAVFVAGLSSAQAQPARITRQVISRARAQTPAFTVIAYSSLQAFRAEALPPGGADSIRLSAARGETESFQRALAPRAGETLRDIRVSVTGLTDVETQIFAASAINVSAELYDAAVLQILAPGSYTVPVAGANGTTGLALVEGYEVP